MVQIRDYEKDKELIRQVLLGPKYTDALVKVAHREQVSFVVDLDDVEQLDQQLAEAVINNAKRYVQLFSTILDEILPDFRVNDLTTKDTFDVFIEHRIHTEQRSQPPTLDGSVDPNYTSKYPPELMRRYELYFKPMSIERPRPIRMVKAKDIGKLVTISGIITRCTEVKPLLMVATYTCDSCAAETYQPIGASSLMPLERCQSEECKTNRTAGRLFLQTRGSKFMKYQELRIQEHSGDVPIGNIPRSLNIICRGEMTRIALPGDHVNISGIFLPVARTGFRQMTSGLLSDTYLEAHRISITNKMEDDVDDEMDDEQFRKYILSENITINRLANSIAPEIYGHLDLKKALLLMLVGGVEQNSNGMKIRGAINICLMGDPGVAKSQLLGFIDRIAPRSQYTTGRGSSGVGLTAAVMKDPITGEFVLEGGALVLADKGICCIDEFDKMMESDRTAIHEVMEQQTISIAKAGIHTTLNARVSILAAANPAYGRYNTKKSIEHNIQLPAALLSRFDLLWLITDQANPENDLKLAQHIAYVHQHYSQPPLEFEPLPIKVMRRYINLARKYNPTIPPHLTEDTVNAYIEMRNEARNNQNSTFTSARTLLGILRIATALARLRLSHVVERGDIMESIRLIEVSKSSIQVERNQVVQSKNEKIYHIIYDMSGNAQSREVEMGEAIEQCKLRGYSNDDIEDAIEEFELNNMWHISSDRSKIIFV